MDCMPDSLLFSTTESRGTTRNKKDTVSFPTCGSQTGYVPPAVTDKILCACLQRVGYNFHWVLNPERLGINGDLKVDLPSPFPAPPVTYKPVTEVCQFFLLNCSASNPFCLCPTLLHATLVSMVIENGLLIAPPMVHLPFSNLFSKGPAHIFRSLIISTPCLNPLKDFPGSISAKQ